MDPKQQLHDFIKMKQKYQSEDLLPVWIFEMDFFKELCDQYQQTMKKFEEQLEEMNSNTDWNPKKVGKLLGGTKRKLDNDLEGVKVIHVATRKGFSKQQIVLLEEESSSASRREKTEQFQKVFTSLIQDTDLVPDKSVLLISQELHHTAKVSRRDSIDSSSKMRKREMLSQVKGQKMMTDFFKSNKSTSSSVPYKKPELVQPSFQIEKIVHNFRSDKVKILWIPKRHCELDASQFVSVFLLDQISKFYEAEGSENKDVKHHCTQAINKIPNGVWEMAAEFNEECEKFYLQEAQFLKIKDLKDEESDKSDGEDDKKAGNQNLVNDNEEDPENLLKIIIKT